MPLDRFVLILVIVVAIAAATVGIGVFVAASVAMPGWAAFAALPILICLYIAFVIVRDRVRNSEDAHYDQIER